MNNALSLLYQSTDLALEAEFLESLRKRRAAEAEVGLMLAILEDAVGCFQKYLPAKDQRGKVLFREAEDWIFSRESDWFFSFAHICEVLGFDPEYVRQGMLSWKERNLAGGPKAKVYQFPSTRRKKRPRRKAPKGKSSVLRETWSKQIAR